MKTTLAFLIVLSIVGCQTPSVSFVSINDPDKEYKIVDLQMKVISSKDAYFKVYEISDGRTAIITPNLSYGLSKTNIYDFNNAIYLTKEEVDAFRAILKNIRSTYFGEIKNASGRFIDYMLFSKATENNPPKVLMRIQLRIDEDPYSNKTRKSMVYYILGTSGSLPDTELVKLINTFEPSSSRAITEGTIIPNKF